MIRLVELWTYYGQTVSCDLLKGRLNFRVADDADGIVWAATTECRIPGIKIGC